MEDMANEDWTAIQYMLGFRVTLCEGCPSEATCFNAHSINKQRRRVERDVKGKWNYSSAK
jgi:hypothetical protein